MPNFKNPLNIQPINFTTGIAIDLKQTMKEIEILLKTGIFLVPGWTLKLKGIKQENLNAFWYILSYRPNAKDLTQINQTPIHAIALQSYNIQAGLSANLIFSVHDRKINGFATDLDPEIFRKLMCLSFKSMAFYQELELTDYWLPKTNTSENSPFFKTIMSAMPNLTNPHNKSTFLQMSIPAWHQYTNHSLKIDLEKAARSANPIKEKDLAYAGAKKRGFTDTLDVFTDPTSESSINFVRQQIIDLLIQHKVLLSPNKEPKQKRLVLFVGEGDASNMYEIQKRYPQFECFAIEPHFRSAELAKEKVGVDRVFEMTLQEFPLPSRKFDKIFIFNYNINSFVSSFMRQLRFLLQDDGEVIIGAPLVDPIHIGGNFSLTENLVKAFGEENVCELPKNYNFTQRLYRAKGCSKIPEEKDTLSPTPLAIKINEITKDYRQHILEEQTRKNQAAYLRLNECIEFLNKQNATVELSVTNISIFKANNSYSSSENITPTSSEENADVVTARL